VLKNKQKKQKTSNISNLNQKNVTKLAFFNVKKDLHNKNPKIAAIFGFLFAKISLI